MAITKENIKENNNLAIAKLNNCLLYTSDAADE